VGVRRLGFLDRYSSIMSSRNYHVAPDQARQTLAAVLRHWMPGESWTRVRQLLKTRQVMVNGNLCLDEGRRLKPGDVVKVLDHPQAPVPREEDVRIRHVDEHLLVVEKPAGMTTLRHAEERSWPARRKQLQPTLDDVLPRLLQRQQGGGPRKAGGRKSPPPRVRAVHRLDRDTSGVMVFARTPVAEQKLIQQFAKHTILRSYLAIALGRVEPGTIESYLVRDRGDGERGSTLAPGEGQRAVTHVRPLESLGDYTLIECRLETGRTHQSLILLAAQGHRRSGEKMYHRARDGRLQRDTSGAPRTALHAAELGFEHPITGKSLHFKSSFPPDLAEFLKRLRQRFRDRTAGRER
jgi:23S rRNA pseudouridine1911/1915/1917 synthase